MAAIYKYTPEWKELIVLFQRPRQCNKSAVASCHGPEPCVYQLYSCQIHYS